MIVQRCFGEPTEARATRDSFHSMLLNNSERHQSYHQLHKKIMYRRKKGKTKRIENKKKRIENCGGRTHRLKYVRSRVLDHLGLRQPRTSSQEETHTELRESCEMCHDATHTHVVPSMLTDGINFDGNVFRRDLFGW